MAEGCPPRCCKERAGNTTAAGHQTTASPSVEQQRPPHDQSTAGRASRAGGASSAQNGCRLARACGIRMGRGDCGGGAVQRREQRLDGDDARGGYPTTPVWWGGAGRPTEGGGTGWWRATSPPPHGEPLGGGWRQPDSDTRCRPWGRYRHPAEGALPRSTVRLMDWVCARVILCLSRWDRLRCGRQRTLVARAAGGSRTSRGRIQTGGRAARLAESVHPPDRLKTLESRARTVSRSVGRDSPPQNGAA